MRTLYEASNSLEAHMILNLLELQGLSGRIDGEYLQGGMGELPAAGLVRVMVAEEDYQAAKEIVNKWEASQPAPSTQDPPTKSPSQSLIFFGGVVVGFLLALLVA
jgi:hypothetical protein